MQTCNQLLELKENTSYKYAKHHPIILSCLSQGSSVFNLLSTCMLFSGQTFGSTSLQKPRLEHSPTKPNTFTRQHTQMSDIHKRGMPL
ncbi:hypothetical protein I79_025987 [Cricetulus griseus]|uniref:Uncharacterized protein n=1 Tax=Cricetulus griseus TaxID=10029 RepID=G3IPR6_CRIGR|nr:hypothetical protein I79_025987 [Cricetulus griseus]